jgi:hypothetical protein
MAIRYLRSSQITLTYDPAAEDPVANAIAQAGELIEPFGKYLLGAEAALEHRPERLVGDCVLQLPEIGVLKRPERRLGYGFLPIPQ